MNPVIQRLQLVSTLSVKECQVVEDLTQKSVRHLAPDQDLIRQGDCTSTAFMLLDGWAAGHKILEDGRRQTTSFLLPGDVFGLSAYLLKQADHWVSGITCGRVAELSRDDFQELADLWPTVTKCLVGQQLVLTAIEREWVVNVGRRTACQRIAHLFCEIFFRLSDIGLTDGQECEVPLTQSQIADATGLTTVHANRVLQELRREELVVLARRTMSIPNLDRLCDFAVFDSAYLHRGDGSQIPNLWKSQKKTPSGSPTP